MPAAAIRKTHRWLALTFCAAAALGCRSTPKPNGVAVSRPAVAVTQTHFAGTALSGPLAVSPTDVMAAWKIDARVYAAPKLPADRFEPIGPRARLVLSEGAGNLLRASSRLVYSAKYRIEGDAFDLSTLADPQGSWFELGDFAGGVVSGSTFQIDFDQTAVVGNDPGRGRLLVQIFRTPGVEGYDLGLVAEDRTEPTTRIRPLAADPSPTSRPARDARETVVVRRQITTETDRLLLTVPMPLTQSPFVGVVLDVRINTRPPLNASDLVQMRADLRAAVAAAQQQAGRPPSSPQEALLSAALDALSKAGDAPRPQLVYLAQQAGATLAENVALVADDRVLALIAKNVRERIAQLQSRSPADVSWLLERVTIQTIASVSDEEGSVRRMSAVQGVLANYAGEAGRQLDLLQSLANESAGSEDLRSRIVAEHLIYLEDNAPGVRVRAFDWLRGRNLAPAGFDPMADAFARRAALAKARDAAATQP